MFLQNFHFGPIRWVPKQFFKFSIIFGQNLHFNLDFWIIFENCSMHMLSIWGYNFIAHWAYKDTIYSHTEHSQNEFSRMLSQRKNVNSCLHLCWAYGEMISSHPEHPRKSFKRWSSTRGKEFIADWAYAEMFKSRISRLNQIRFSKISCYRPLGS
jgi:hypothetical protein